MTRDEAIAKATDVAQLRADMGHGHTFGPAELVDVLAALDVVKLDAEPERKALPAPSEDASG